MAKFCKYCGKELEEGMVCSCSESQMNVENVTNESKSQAKSFWGLFTSFIKKPVSIGAEFVNSCNYKYAFILIAIHSVLIGLLMVSLTGKINSAIKDAMFLMGGGDYDSITLAGYTFPRLKIFFVAAIVCFGIACLIALVLMLFVKMFKGNTTYKYMICVSSLNSLVLIPFVLCAAVISFLMPFDIDIRSAGSVFSIFSPFVFPISIACVGMTLGNYIMLSVVYAGSDVNKEYIPYVLFFTGIVMSIAFYLVFKVAAPMCLPTAVRDTLDATRSSVNMLESIF